MSLETSPNDNNDRAIQEAADKLIASAAAKHGLTIEQVPQSAKDEAYKYARESVESEARKQSNEYYHLYEAQKQETELLKAQLGAVRDNKVAATDTRVVQSMERTRDLMGRANWFQLSEGQKIAALGSDPATVDKEQLRRLFGKNTDTAYAVDFQKVQPFVYRKLREIAKALNITGK